MPTFLEEGVYVFDNKQKSTKQQQHQPKKKVLSRQKWVPRRGKIYNCQKVPLLQKRIHHINLHSVVSQPNIYLQIILYLCKCKITMRSHGISTTVTHNIRHIFAKHGILPITLNLYKGLFRIIHYIRPFKTTHLLKSIHLPNPIQLSQVMNLINVYVKLLLLTSRTILRRKLI